MELHYKCTMWCTLQIPEGVKKKDVIKKLKQGCLPLEICYDDVIPNMKDVEWSTINDTEEYLTPEQNDNQSTIELMEYQKGKLGLQVVWSNEIKNEKK